MRLQTLILAGNLLVLTLSGVSCTAKTETIEDRLSRGAKNLAAGQYQQAEKEFQEVLRRDGANPTAVRELAFLYHDQGQLRQAYPLLKKSAELQPEALDVQVKLAIAYLSVRDNKSARELAEKILEKNPEQEDALLLIADTANTPDEVDATRRYIDDHSKKQDRAGYHLARGALDLRQQKVSEAETELKAAVQLNPKSAATYAALGNLYWSQQNLQAAEQAYKTAADLSPARSPIRLRYIDFKIRTNDIAAATAMVEEIARQAPEFLPTRVYLMKLSCATKREDCASKVEGVLAQDGFNYDALFQSGALSLQKRDAARAIRIFSQLTSFNDRDSRVRYQLALAYLLSAEGASPVDARNASETAENNLNIARQLDSRSEEPALLLAELKIRKGAPAAAVELLLPIVNERPQLAKAHYLLAAAYSAQQMNADAAAVYQRMMENFPKDPEPALLLARVMLQERRAADARGALEKALTISPTYLPAVELLVDMDLGEKQFESALKRTQPLIDQDPNAPQPLAIRGKIYAAQGDLARAEQDVAKAIALDPKLESTHVLLALIYLGLNNPDKAVQTLKNFIANNKSVAAHQQLAVIYLRENKVTEARETYEQLLKIAPNSSVAMNNLAMLYADRLEQLDTAFELANRAREITPNEPHILDTVGWISFKRGDYQNALRELKASASRLPDAEVQYHLGMAYYMVGDAQQAQATLKKAVEAPTDFAQKADARQRLDVLSLQETSSAKPTLEKFLADRPNDPVALTRLASLDLQEGRADDARVKLEKVLQQNPQFTPATRQLALLYGKLSGQDPKAYDVVSKARQAYPDDAEIAKILGILNFRRGLAPQSLELLKEANAKIKDDPELLYYLAEDYRQLKDFDACKDTMQRALSLNLAQELAAAANKALADCAETSPL